MNWKEYLWLCQVPGVPDDAASSARAEAHGHQVATAKTQAMPADAAGE
jgi:hypothetical protein